MPFLAFSHSVGNVIIPIDDLIFFRGVAQPPTSRKFSFTTDEASGVNTAGKSQQRELNVASTTGDFVAAVVASTG